MKYIRLIIIKHIKVDYKFINKQLGAINVYINKSIRLKLTFF